jgi:putative flippase GtrA
MLLWAFPLKIHRIFTIVWCYELFFMWQLIRYGLVGILSNAAIYCVYLLITHRGVEPKVAMTLTYIIGASIGFIGNRKWTFAHRGDYTSAALRYVLAHLFGYQLNFLILFTFVDRLGYAHQWVQGVAIIIVAGFLFIVFKHFVFRERI